MSTLAVFSSGHVSEATHKSYVPSDKGPTAKLVEQKRNLQKKPSLLPGRSVRLADAAATERRAGGGGRGSGSGAGAGSGGDKGGRLRLFSRGGL